MASRVSLPLATRPGILSRAFSYPPSSSCLRDRSSCGVRPPDCVRAAREEESGIAFKFPGATPTASAAERSGRRSNQRGVLTVHVGQGGMPGTDCHPPARSPAPPQALPCLDSPRRFRREIASASRRPNTQTTGITVLRPGLHRITAPQRAMSRRAAGASSPGTRPGVIADSGLACYTAAPSRIEELRRGGSRRENPVRNLSC